MSLSAAGSVVDKPGRCRAEAAGTLLHLILMSVGPVVVALVLSGLVLMVLGIDPLDYYSYVLRRGLMTPLGAESSITRMAPLLLLASGLIVAFRAGLWNLGGDGQFLLGAVAAAAAAPGLAILLPTWIALGVGLGLGFVVGAGWAILPALSRAYQGVNEIITTLMMTFLGVSLSNVLIKLAFFDPATTVPQTRTLPVADRMTRLFGTTISSGVLIGLVAVIAVHLVMTRTAFGLRVRVVGANARAALHAGLSVPRLTVTVFALSGGLCGLAGAVEVLGVEGNVRADWNPSFSMTVVPLVFLARLNGFAAIAFVFLFSVLSIGGESAARHFGVPNFFTPVIVAILLIVLSLAEYADQSYRARRGR